MAKTTATFPPLWQAKVKSKVFEMVNSYELALLQNSSASPAPPPLLIESHTPTQHQSQIQDMHNVAMQSQLPLQIQPPIQIEPPREPPMQTMQMLPSVQNKLSSTSFYHNRPILPSQGPSAEFYSTFGNHLSNTEISNGQNTVGVTREHLDTTRDLSQQRQGDFSY